VEEFERRAIDRDARTGKATSLEPPTGARQAIGCDGHGILTPDLASLGVSASAVDTHTQGVGGQPGLQRLQNLREYLGIAHE